MKEIYKCKIERKKEIQKSIFKSSYKIFEKDKIILVRYVTKSYRPIETGIPL